MDLVVETLEKYLFSNDGFPQSIVFIQHEFPKS